jgi:hypothetical protein
MKQFHFIQSAAHSLKQPGGDLYFEQRYGERYRSPGSWPCKGKFTSKRVPFEESSRNFKRRGLPSARDERTIIKPKTPSRSCGAMALYDFPMRIVNPDQFRSNIL